MAKKKDMHGPYTFNQSAVGEERGASPQPPWPPSPSSQQDGAPGQQEVKPPCPDSRPSKQTDN